MKGCDQMFLTSILFSEYEVLVADSRYWKQGVQLLSVPQPIDSIMASCAEVEASFDHLTGELSIKSSFSQL